MKINPEINFTFEFSEDEMKLLLDAFSLNNDNWESSFEKFNEKLLNAYSVNDTTSTLSLNDAKELMGDITVSDNFPSELNELWGALWNALKGY